MKTLKDMGFKIKLDTNGLRPDTIRAALDAHMVDYIAMDYKAPKSKFYTVTKSNHYASFSESLDLLCQQTSVPFEIRTTVHIEQLQEEDIVQIMHDLSARHFRGTYYIQNFVTANDRPNLGQLRPQSRYLNLDVLPLPRGYTLAFRNFPGILSRP
jgi:pyruvate formate lyase activating enzyme